MFRISLEYMHAVAINKKNMEKTHDCMSNKIAETLSSFFANNA